MEPKEPADPEGTAREPTRFPIVGIGASAGGLEALEALTSRLSADGMAFIVLQHLAPGHESALTEILARGTAMKVVTVKDDMPVAAGRIYVAPPNVDVAMQNGVLRLTPPAPDRRGPRLSIDAFFRSLAEDQGATAIGVILSGAGTDGTLGLKAIKEKGGITFVQEPSTASQPSMPQSALDAGCADFCLGPPEIADELVRLASHPYVAAPLPPKLFDEDARSELFGLLQRAFGVDFAAYKQTTIERRTQRRMALHKIDRFEDYLRHVQSNAAELNALYSDLLIAVTGFFRDQEPFEALKSVVFPRLLENRRKDAPLRIWVAGCATGEEAYSIVMCLLEHLGDHAPDFPIQIFATDVDERSLARARLAIYPHNIELDVSPERLQRFFSRSEKGYQLHRAVRDLVVFARHNLGKDPPFSHVDLVSCRNVLIYMQPVLQKKVLRIFHYSLNPDAFLLLGSSDSVGDGTSLFSLLDRRAKLYTKKDIVATVAFDLSFGARAGSDDRAARSELRPAPSVLQLADRKVLEQYGPPGVVVNEVFDILQYRGKSGRFFEPAPGVATTNLLKLARPELLPELRASLHKALAENVRVISSPVHPWHDSRFLTLRIDVTPLAVPGATAKTLVVLFNEERGEDEPQEGTVGDRPPPDTRVQELERELATAKEYLQTTIQNFEAANEALQSANEELQTTNEELETSKEELQSTNEELVTLNEELHNRMAQLDETNDDMQNVFGAATSALVLVDMDLRIRRFSTAAEKLLKLGPGDLGRPLGYVRTVIQARDIEETASNVISTASATELKVRGSDGHWFAMRITPYRTADLVVRGAVIELSKAVADENGDDPSDLHGLGRAILATLPQALALLDERLCVTWGNPAFLELFQLGADVFGRPFEDLWAGKTEQHDLWKLLEDAAIRGRPFHKSLTGNPFSRKLTGSLVLSARRLPHDDDQPLLTLIIVQERAGEGNGRDGS